MYLLNIINIFCLFLYVSCAPQRYWRSDDVRPVSTFLYPSRRVFLPPSYSSESDELTKALDDLQRSRLFTLLSALPGLSVSASTNEDDYEDAGTGISVGVTGLGRTPFTGTFASSGFGSASGGDGFGSVFNQFGDDVKNKTTVKTEVIDGHKVTVKESTYVSDNGGFKSVIHLKEIDVADSKESEEPKNSTTKSNEEGVENSDEENEKTSTVSIDVNKTTKDVNSNTPTTENSKSIDTEEVNETNQVVDTKDPNSEVETIETLDDNKYYNYRLDKNNNFKEVGKLIKTRKAA